jgi:hydrogenase maturation protein HypF
LAEKYTEGVFGVYKKMKQRNTLKTSSVGRLFDAVASMLGICDQNTYEGESAILLENCISEYILEDCKSYISLDETGRIPTYDLIDKLYVDLQKGVAKEQLILNFLYTLATLVFQIAERNKIDHIACSGGVFQNTILVDMIKEIAANKYKLYFNCNLSPNDENISFGQLMYYVNCMDN